MTDGVSARKSTIKSKLIRNKGLKQCLKILNKDILISVIDNIQFCLMKWIKFLC